MLVGSSEGVCEGGVGSAEDGDVVGCWRRGREGGGEVTIIVVEGRGRRERERGRGGEEPGEGGEEVVEGGLHS